MVEAAWLIERCRYSRTEWFTGREQEWSTESLDAVRFSREEDAQTMIAFLGDSSIDAFDDAAAIEHMWLPPAAAEPAWSDCRRCAEAAAVDGRWPETMRRMFLCPTCGNKRCPRATNHVLDCTGSNESGQPGSDY